MRPSPQTPAPAERREPSLQRSGTSLTWWLERATRCGCHLHWRMWVAGWWVTGCGHFLHRRRWVAGCGYLLHRRMWAAGWWVTGCGHFLHRRRWVAGCGYLLHRRMWAAGWYHCYCLSCEGGRGWVAGWCCHNTTLQTAGRYIPHHPHTRPLLSYDTCTQ